MYLLVSVLILAFCAYVALAPRFESFRVNRQLSLGLFFTFAATFVGVFAAQHVSGLEARRAEESRAIALLTIAQRDVESAIGSLDGAVRSVLERRSPGGRAFFGFSRTNPFRGPEILWRLLENDQFLTALTPLVFGAILNAQDNMQKVLDRVNGENELSDAEYLDRLRVVKSELMFVTAALEVELEHKKNDLSGRDALERLDKARFAAVEWANNSGDWRLDESNAE